MNKDKAIDLYLNGIGTLKRCPECGDMVVVFTECVDFTGCICLNEECDYKLETLEGGLESE